MPQFKAYQFGLRLEYDLLSPILIQKAWPLFLSWVCGTCNLLKPFGWLEEIYENKHSIGYTMDKGENNFPTLFMAIAGNLIVEARYQNLEVNFNHCFKYNICQNQVYKFICFIF